MLRLQGVIKRFCEHNRKRFGFEDGHSPVSPIILMELNPMHSCHISYAYLANELAREHGAQIKAYAPRAIHSPGRRLSYLIKAALGWEEFGVYRSFGTNEFIEIRLEQEQRQRARELQEKVLGGIQNTRDIEDLHVNSVWIGDLVYDTFLKTYKQATIDPGSLVFRKFMLESMELFVFWDDYLRNHDVRGINVSHCVYNLAIPLRLAITRGIAVFQANTTHIYRLSKENLFAYNDFFHFRERFAALPADVRETGISLAERRIQRRFNGEVGVDMTYSSKSAYGTSRHAQLLRESPRKKILVATHCFFDSPHSYGKNTFPDFYQWLEFLGLMSNKTDYDWYIKTHPDYVPGTMEIIEDFVVRYPKFTLLPSDASHMQIIDEGIDVALTCYGTIGFEYAALGVPVINASMNNPHIAYNFNIHVKDVEDYRSSIENLEEIGLVIDEKEVYEYYFMKFIFNTENIFFENYEKFLNDIGGYKNQFTPLAYEKWLAEWSLEKHKEICNSLQKFIISGDFRMDARHTGKEFTLEEKS